MYDKLETITNVIDCYEYNGDIYATLEENIFYATSGGQSHDIGTIADAIVTDVIKHDGKILHKVDRKVTGEVKCVVDEDVRYNNSLLHSAQHLLSAVFERAGYDTTSFSMKDNYFTIDILSKLDRDELDKYEDIINDCIRLGYSIYSRKYDASLDADLDVSYIDASKNDIQLVIIDGIDKNPCGGTHVNDTSEIEYLKIVKYKYSGDKTKIDVMIGFDAIDFVNACFNEHYEIVKLINQNKVSAYDYIETKLKENKKLSKTISKLEKSNNGS